MTQVATMSSTERDLTSSSDEQRSTSRDRNYRYKLTEEPLFVKRRNRGDIWQSDRERRARLRGLREEGAVGATRIAAQAPVSESNGTNRGGSWMDGPRRMTLTEAFALTGQTTSPPPSAENTSTMQGWGSKARKKPWMSQILEPDVPVSSPEQSKIWDADLDFTAQSLQVSTSPQLRVKNSRLDDIRSKEIQKLTARAVATSRLEEIRERNSEERSFSPESQTNMKEILPSEDVAAEGWEHKSILEEEGEKIPYTPITVFRKKDFEEYVKRNNITFGRDRSNSNSNSTSNTSSRPHSRDLNMNSDKPKVFATNFGEGFKKRRDEQREVLRRLSRACSRSSGSDSSSSPAPPKVDEGKEELVNCSEAMNDCDAEKLDALVPAEPANPSDTVSDSKTADSIKADIPKEDMLNHSGPLNDLQATDAQKPDIIMSDTSKPEASNHSDPVNDLKASDTSTPASKSDVDPEERITAEARLFELQDNKSERNSIRALSPTPSEDGKFDETPRPKADPLSLPTPRVTGAYIETPAPITRVIRQRSISPSYEVVDAPEIAKDMKSEMIASLSERYRTKREQRKKSISPPRGRFHDARPRPLINTATPVSAAEDVRRIRLEAQVEDSTLDNFDAILDAEAATEDHTTILEPVFDLEYDERGLPLSTKEIERRIERLTLDRMNQSLKATSSSIRDAKHGIERLEEQVSSSFIRVTKPDDGIMYINIKIPVPKLYISQPAEKPGMKTGWKFTWLGLILSLFLFWYVAESAMCSQFCHPLASSKNTWQPSDPFFPWAIPTKLDQWTGEVVSSGLECVASSLGIRDWDWSPIPTLASNYKGGPIGSSDWWLGRSGPIGLMHPDTDGGFDDDETI